MSAAAERLLRKVTDAVHEYDTATPTPRPREGMPPLNAEDNLICRLKSVRLARGWSQYEVARRLQAIGQGQISQSVISDFESDGFGSGPRRRVRLDEAVAFAWVFGLTLGELITPTDEAVSE